MKLITLLTMVTMAVALVGCKPSAESNDPGMGGTSTNTPGGVTTNSMSSPDLRTAPPTEQPAPAETTPPPQQ